MAQRPPGTGARYKTTVCARQAMQSDESRIDCRVKISIITACLNRKEFIGAAVERSSPKIIQNLSTGLSTGDRRMVRSKFLRRYPHLNYLSEPDRGVYDAWNKGINRASGDVVSILNSDDVYAAGALHSYARMFAASRSAPMVSGGYQIFRMSQQGTAIEMHHYQDPKRYRLSLRNATVGLPIINSRFFRRSLFDRVGRFDLKYAVASDREFIIRAALSGIQDVSTCGNIFTVTDGVPDTWPMNPGNGVFAQGLGRGIAHDPEVPLNGFAHALAMIKRCTNGGASWRPPWSWFMPS